MPKSTPNSEHKATTIKAIFTNLLFVLGIILMVVGFVTGASTIAKIVLFDVYPLPTYEEDRCNMQRYMEPAVVSGVVPAAESTESAKAKDEKAAEEKMRCENELARYRRVKETEDVVGAISFSIAGIALVTVFKQFIFRKEGRG